MLSAHRRREDRRRRRRRGPATKGSKNQRRSGSFSFSSNSRRIGAHFLAQFDAEPDRVVPENLARTSLHHLRADVERGEDRIERRRRGVQQEALVEAAMLDAPLLAADMAVPGVDLRGLRKARELLMRRLGGDDARRVGVEVLQPHGETACVERMELHEAGPGLVEQNVVAEAADLLEDHLGVVDRAVVGALLDDGDAERPLAPPGLLVLDQRIGADFLADRRLVERLVVDRPDQAVGVAVGLEEDRNRAAEEQRAVMGGLVIVAVEQDEVAFGDQRREHDLVRGRRAVEHEIGLLGAEDRGGLLLRLRARGPHGRAGRRVRARNCRDRRGRSPRRDAATKMRPIGLRL